MRMHMAAACARVCAIEWLAVASDRIAALVSSRLSAIGSMRQTFGCGRRGISRYRPPSAITSRHTEPLSSQGGSMGGSAGRSLRLSVRPSTGQLQTKGGFAQRKEKCTGAHATQQSADKIEGGLQLDWICRGSIGKKGHGAAFLQTFDGDSVAILLQNRYHTKCSSSLMHIVKIKNVFLTCMLMQSIETCRRSWR
jgi:hypothetical protein